MVAQRFKGIRFIFPDTTLFSKSWFSNFFDIQVTFDRNQLEGIAWGFFFSRQDLQSMLPVKQKSSVLYSQAVKRFVGAQ